MAFDVLDLDITLLFKNDDEYRIPRYQRNYVWNEENWMQLLKDIEYCAEVTPEWSHFIGSMVFERKEKSGGEVDIIDGQQRIITLQIVVFALIYCYENLKIKTQDEKEKAGCDRRLNYLRDLIINKTLEDETPKLSCGYSGFTELNQEMVEKVSKESLEKIYEKFVAKKGKRECIERAFGFFVNYFSEYNYKALYEFTGQFVKMRVVTISSTQQEEVYNIFEILNARGTKLKQIELLKNYLFKYLKPKALLDQYKDKWIKMEEILADIDLDDYYLHMFRCRYSKEETKKKETKKSELFDVTKQILHNFLNENEKEMECLFAFMTENAQYYRDIADAKGLNIETEVYEYFKLKNIRGVRSVFVALKIKYEASMIKIEKYKKVLTWLRNFFIVFYLDQQVSNKIDNEIYNLAYNIYKSNTEDEVEYSVLLFLNKLAQYFENEKILEAGLNRLAYSNKSTRKNITSKLLVYFFKPMFLQCEENEFCNYDFSKFNMEHIINDDEMDNERYGIGNLLLCPEKINSHMKDKSYAEKRKILIDSKIPYLVKFAEAHSSFDKKDVKNRTNDLVSEFKEYFFLSYSEISKRFSELNAKKLVREELIKKFGNRAESVSVLEKRGINGLRGYAEGNTQLTEDVKESIIEIIVKFTESKELVCI